MDKVFSYVLQHSGDRQALTNSKLHLGCYDNLYDEAEQRHANTIGSRQVSPWVTTDNLLYQRNLAALQKYYPRIYAAILAHQPEHWQLVTDDKGKANLWQPQRQALFYRDIDNDSQQMIDDFCQHPFQDDVFIGHRPGYKLRSYLHNQQVTKLLPILERSVKKRNYLPQQIDSLIVFGIALGSHISLLLQQHRVQNLYVCEPNLDFFIASLYVTDWAAIFERTEQQQQRIYLNLGGDGSQYFQDMMRQFYMVGAYSIANTYLLTSYYSERMHKAITELRANLKVVLAVGEYFDHARFGIAHTYGDFATGGKLLQPGCARRRYPIQQLPVFVVGNGPSLDQCFDYLREYQQQAIIISCGTALQALYRHGIQPDFHAELEQNRATYDWISQIGDPAWLKGIKLLSVNGIHPDTAELFEQTLLSFKEGEASTVVFQQALKAAGIKTASLSYAYPTVANFVVNTVLKLGCKLVYLFGVDLGFADINYHHSKSSLYYKADGQQIYDYQKAHGGGLQAAGNFRPQVFTKTEFDVSRKLLEQAIKTHKVPLELYNCSDGVKIAGTTALTPDNILLPAQSPHKKACIEDFIRQAYQDGLEPLADKIFNSFSVQAFADTLDEWQALIAEPVQSATEATALIEQQWQLLRNSVKSKNDLTYMMFFGSTNYISAVLTKLAAAISEDAAGQESLQAFNEVLAIWREYLALAKTSYCDEPLQFDSVSMQYLMARHQQA